MSAHSNTMQFGGELSRDALAEVLGPELGSLLVTKLIIPPTRMGALSRVRLWSDLDAALAVPLTLVAAPAGFGKTTLLASWLQRMAEGGRLQTDGSEPQPAAHSPQRATVAWVSLDPSDNDPVTFGCALIGALRLGGAAVGAASLALLQGAQPRPLAAAIAPLLNDLAAIPGHTVLVLDDYHSITEPAIHEALAFAIERLSPRTHLILASRTDPPLPLPRLRARGHLLELRASTLRFTHDESMAVLQRFPELSLAAPDLARLAAQTEGWPAAIHLAILALRGQAAPATLIAAIGDHPYLFDYLAAEILDQQPSERRDALLQTAILERLSGHMCEALLGLAPGAGAALLARLERDGLPLLPLDGERRWYRHHQLFSAFLRARLRATATPDIITGLYRRAAAAEPDPGTAIGYLLAGGLWDEAADHIEACALSLLAHGQYATVRQWIETIPIERREARPGLCVLLGVIASRRGELTLAETMLTRGVALSNAQHGDAWRAMAWSELALLALQRGEVLRSAEQAEARILAARTCRSGGRRQRARMGRITMAVLLMGALGVVAFVLGSAILGVWLRRNPSVAAADRASRVMHFLFFAGLGAPFLVAMVYPGLTRLDDVAGLEPLPWRPLTLGVGLIIAVPGVYLLAISNRLLRARGHGANAFRLTKRVVEQDIYGSTRNPMSLGYYLAALGVSLLVGSTVLTLYVLVGLIPAHLFFLRFFEERELELRFGEPYCQYRQTVPFLIPRRLGRAARPS